MANDTCVTYSDSCKDDKTVVEYYIDNYRIIQNETYDCSQRTDGLVHCVDGRCGCTSDNDCKVAGITCDAQGYPNRYAQCDLTTHTCTKCGACERKDDCKDTYCCPKEITGYVEATNDYQCTQQGRIINFQGKSYLCDPLNGFTSKAQAKQKSLFESLFEFLNLWVQNFR